MIFSVMVIGMATSNYLTAETQRAQRKTIRMLNTLLLAVPLFLPFSASSAPLR
jgi:hypothetical protein